MGYVDMIRFYLLITLNIFLCYKFYKQLKKIIKNMDSYSRQERYDVCYGMLQTLNRKGKVIVHTYGKENLPNKNGYVMYSNHQGRYDAIGILSTHEKVCSVVMKKEKAKKILMKEFVQVLGAKLLDQKNLREGIKLFKEVEQEINEGMNYLIFPEGYYSNNKNTLQEFHTGCMKFVFKSKCPIIPVTVYDTYKVFGVNSIKKVECEVHYLEPIYYEEYKDLTKIELAELIKGKIQEKLDERNEYYLSHH